MNPQSQSLSFDSQPEEQIAPTQIILTPDSPEFDLGLEEMMDTPRWSNFTQNQDFRAFSALHTKTGSGAGVYEWRTKSAVLKLLDERRPNQMEGLFAATINANGAQKWAFVSLDKMHQHFQQGNPIFLHEALYGPIRPIFDIDFKTRDENRHTDEFRLVTCRRIINGLSHHCGFSADWDDWVILVCPYEGHSESKYEEKFSCRLINREFHFASSTVFGKFLREKLPQNFIDDNFIDMGIYSDFHSLRGVGMSKFVPLSARRVQISPPPKVYPFLVMHPPVHHSEITLAEFMACLAQNVQGTREYHVENQTQELERIEQIRHRGQTNNAGNPLIAGVFSLLKNDGERENRNLELAPMGITVREANNSSDKLISFRIENYEGFRHCTHSEEVGCVIFAESQCFKIDCGTCGRPAFFGLSDFAQQMVEEERYRAFLRLHHWDRPEFPLMGTNMSWGCFGFSDKEFWTARKEEAKNLPLPCRCEWCSDDAQIIPLHWTGDPLPCKFFRDLRSPSIFSRLTFDWLNLRYPVHHNDEDDDFSPQVATYCNFFMCSVEKKYFLRGESIKAYSEAEIKVPLGNLQLRKLTKVGKKKDEEFVWKKADFFSLWKKSASRRIFNSTINTKVDYTQQALNLLCPIATDINCAVQAYHLLDDSVKEMLRWSWIRFLDLFQADEPDEAIKHEIRHYLLRFVNASLFEFSQPAFMSVCVLSETGGQGKSTFGELIGSFLGHTTGYYKSTEGNEPFLDKFNSFVNGLNVINEVQCNQKQAQTLKGKMMSTVFNQRNMFQDAFAIDNRSKYWISSNMTNLEWLGDRGMDRRVMILHVDEVETYEAADLFQHPCEYCEDPISCGHSFYNHTDLMQIFKEHVIPENADLHLPFAGMLHDFIGEDRAIYPDLWSRAAGTFCPMTKAGRDLRSVCADPVVAFLQESMERGYHFSMKTTPPPSFRGQIYLTEGQLTRWNDTEQSKLQKGWEVMISHKTLYQAYLWWCKETGNREAPDNKFIEGVKLFYRENINRGAILPSEMVKTYQMEWKRDELGGNPKWMPTTNPECMERCFKLGGMWKVQAAAKKRDPTMQNRAQLMQSTSSRGAMNRSESFYPLSQQESNSNSFQEAPSILAGLWGEDPQEPYEYRGMGRGEEDIDERRQDIEAADEDRIRKRQRRRKYLMAFDDEAVEVEDEEEEEDLMEN